MGGVAAVMLVMLRSLSYGQAVQSASGSLAGLAPFLEMVDDTIREYREHPAELGSVAIAGVGAIAADDVSFSYTAERPVLHGVSFRIEPGEVIGVVGPSGGGKSTLVQLLLGLRNPTSGRVVVADGVDLRDVDRRSWTDLTAFVAQDAKLVSGTIAQNIAFFREGIEPARIESAALEELGLSDEARDRLVDGHRVEHLGQLGDVDPAAGVAERAAFAARGAQRAYASRDVPGRSEDIQQSGSDPRVGGELLAIVQAFSLEARKTTSTWGLSADGVRR